MLSKGSKNMFSIIPRHYQHTFVIGNVVQFNSHQMCAQRMERAEPRNEKPARQQTRKKLRCKIAVDFRAKTTKSAERKATTIYCAFAMINP